MPKGGVTGIGNIPRRHPRGRHLGKCGSKVFLKSKDPGGFFVEGETSADRVGMGAFSLFDEFSECG